VIRAEPAKEARGLVDLVVAMMLIIGGITLGTVAGGWPRPTMHARSSS
jgi:hypothetical protein